MKGRAPNRYRLVVTWTHRKWGPQMEKRVAEGSSIRRAINRSLLDFFKDKNKRQERRDAHVQLTITAQRLKRERAR
jgi:hypothetical protein